MLHSLVKTLVEPFTLEKLFQDAVIYVQQACFIYIYILYILSTSINYQFQLSLQIPVSVPSSSFERFNP